MEELRYGSRVFNRDINEYDDEELCDDYEISDNN